MDIEINASKNNIHHNSAYQQQPRPQTNNNVSATELRRKTAQSSHTKYKELHKAAYNKYSHKGRMVTKYVAYIGE